MIENVKIKPDKMKVFTSRLPLSLLEQLREQAKSEGMKFEGLLTRLVRQGRKQEESRA